MAARTLAGRHVPAKWRAAGAVAALTGLRASTNLQETSDLVWTLLAIAVAGAIVTFSFLVYSIWRFRDPRVKGRRYG
jgi:hypothetical protein